MVQHIHLCCMEFNRLIVRGLMLLTCLSLRVEALIFHLWKKSGQPTFGICNVMYCATTI